MKICATTDYNMIVKRDTDHLAGFDESFRLRQIFFAWRCVSAWMRVGDDYRCRAKTNSIAEDVARVERRSVKHSAKHKHRLAQKPPLRIEIEGKGILLLFVNTGGQYLSHNIIRSLYCTFE